ncbi:MAG: prepilin-type N-terminal cleavage/methylation domain-containing protein [Desulforegulaceae bacterium]|jgi:prepilin-type N-terminal cleavage/methylation domain-containing protein|nr:prepilin-type N-terminal cleavage/methylation domain-containing protein [Desulforegulaceae bacterium]
MDLIFVKNKGFSLIEVLIAIAIFSIAILAINSLQVRNIKTGADSRRMTEAAYFANAKMEELIGVSYKDLNDADSDGNTEKDTNGDGTNDAYSLDDVGADADGNETMGAYQVCWNIAEDDIIEGTKTIKVIALFKFNEDASDGQPAKVALQRIVSR